MEKVQKKGNNVNKPSSESFRTETRYCFVIKFVALFDGVSVKLMSIKQKGMPFVERIHSV
jgi:hypothetical protein